MSKKKEFTKKAQIKATSITFIEQLNKFCDKNIKILLPLIILLSAVFTFLLYDLKISEAHDDALYIESAYKFSQNFWGYYTANAPFYPIFLSFFIDVFGFNIVVLKLTSTFFGLLHLIVFYYFFKDRVSTFVLLCILFFTGISSYFLYYNSMTFTEQFFLFLQTCFLLLFYKEYEKSKSVNSSLKILGRFLIPALVLLILTLSRNIAIGIIIPVVVYLLFERKIKLALLFIVAFAATRGSFEVFKSNTWGGQNQFSAQGSSLIVQKDPYDPSKGTEDLSGYVQRFFDNYNIYISKRFFQLTGFLGEGSQSVIPGLGLLFAVLMIYCFYRIIKSKNSLLLLLFIYTVAMCAFTFVALQKSWDQYRLIMVFVPFILIIIFDTLFSSIKNNFGQSIVLLFLAIILTSSTIHTIRKSSENYPTLIKNLGGDLYAGYTPDWINYLKLSTWCADSLPKESLVAARKAPMSFVYGHGKEFYPIYTVFSHDPDSVLNRFKNEKVEYVILASLRRNPAKNDGYIINTVHRLLQPVAQKYPSKLSLVKQIGETEPAYLYRINN